MKVLRGTVLAMALTLVLAGVTAGTTPRSLPVSTSRNNWEGLAIVVNPSNPVDNLSLPQLRAVFLGERRWWSHRRRIALSAMRRGTPERQTVLRVIYGMNDHDLEKYFLYQTYKGEASHSPATLQSPADVKKFVRTTPGAVGYMRASDVDSSVKVIRINGLLPEDDGYPLRLRSKSAK